MQLASALDYAHQNSLIHREVKSSNVIVGGSDRVTLMDSGLVKALEGQRGALTGGSQNDAPGARV